MVNLLGLWILLRSPPEPERGMKGKMIRPLAKRSFLNRSFQFP